MSEVLRLKYRPFVQSFYKWIIGLTVVSELIIIRLNVYDVSEESALLASLKLLLASTVPISIFIRVVFFIRPRIYSEFDLYDEKIIVHQGKKEKEVLFDQVRSVRVSWFSPRFFGGFTLELKSGQKISFLSVLKNNHLVLTNLFKVNPEVLSDEKFKAYLKTSQAVEHSWARIGRKFKDWKCWVPKYFAFPMAVALGLHLAGWVITEEYNYLVLWLWATVIAWCIAFSLNHVEERWINSGLVEGRLPEGLEKRAETTIMLCYYGLCIVILVGIVYLT